ncbi:MAG: pyridoxal phosphate-dependent decarboxylase family protein [Chloroflexota bacterium]
MARPVDPPTSLDAETYLERFGWHPEPELVAYRDESASREAMERLGAATWRAALDYLYGHALVTARGLPNDYPGTRRSFYAPGDGPSAAPSRPTPAGALLDEFMERLAPHQLNPSHPRHFGYFTPPPLVMSVMGELLAQVANQGIDVWHAGPTGALVEEEVIRWLCELVGFADTAFGVLTSGGVMANFMGLALARDVQLGRIVGGRPPRGADLEGGRVYASDQAHFSVARALDELGFPPETLVVVPSDDRFQLTGEAVADAVARDRAAGCRPFAIAAVAGSTNTGSVDRIGELADLASREGLWLHVDAAYGGAARLSARDASRVADLDRADSLTLDPHKWFFQPYDVGGLLVREGRHLLEVFGGRRPEYYRGAERPVDRPLDGGHDGEGGHDSDADGDALSFYRLSFEGTRRWRALKLWLSWKHLGTEGLGRLVAANIDLAAYLTRRVAASDDFEAVIDPPELSVVCFRHLPPGAASLPAAEIDGHQDRLQSALEASGDGWLTTTRLRGRTWLRAGIMNFLSTEADVDRLLEDLRALA